MGSLVSAGQALAQTPPLSAAPSGATSSAAAQFWTPQRLLNAKPIELLPAPNHQLQSLSTVGTGGPVQSGAGAAPSDKSGPSLQRLHPEIALPARNAISPGGELASPQNTSSTGAYFTTSRVFPDAATTTYPYSTAGKLFAHNPRTGNTLNCSASVLRPRLVVTAGHCVYHAGPTTGDDTSKNVYFYDNFRFVPAYNNGAAPLGSWNWSYAIVSGFWTTGGGGVPNTQDVAILEMADQNGGKIGSRTGYLGYQTGGLSPNHLTIVGYPCNIDSCVKEQNTNAQSFANGGSNTVTYGSAQRGGTSGGPWIQDFGIAGSGAPSGTALNYLKSVSSYGPTATEPKYLGGSILLGSGTSSFIDILNKACAHKAGNC